MVEPYYSTPDLTLHVGDCLNVMRTMPDSSAHAVVTDPPAGVAFMNKGWDSDRGGRDKWIAWLTERMAEAFRVLTPGGHALVWALPRTSHWTATALEDAGFEIRDCIVHMFGSGFPKSLDVGRAIDARRDDRQAVLQVTAWLAAARDAAGWTNSQIDDLFGFNGMGGLWTTQGVAAIVPTWDQWLRLKRALGLDGEMDAEVQRLNARKRTPEHARVDRIVAPKAANRVLQPTQSVLHSGTPVLDDAARWSGWGTALKPGQEHWWLVRKPLAGTVAQTVLEYGTGALNIAACRVEAGQDYRDKCASVVGLNSNRNGAAYGEWTGAREDSASPLGRWPSNLVLSHSASCGEDGPCQPDCPVRELDRQSGVTASSDRPRRNTAEAHNRTASMGKSSGDWVTHGHADVGGASRYFPTFRYEAKAPASERPKLSDGTAHATVKPLALMRWLVRLITPPGGTVLDPFAGTGTTGEACAIEGAQAVLIELDPKHADLIKRRLSKNIQPVLFSEVADA